LKRFAVQVENLQSPATCLERVHAKRGYTRRGARLSRREHCEAISGRERERQREDLWRHRDYHSMDDPSGPGLFSKSHRAATRLAIRMRACVYCTYTRTNTRDTRSESDA